MTSNMETLNSLIANDISCEVKNGLIKTVQKRLNSDNFNIQLEHGSKKGDNFMGEIYRVLYKDANDKENKTESSLILKTAPSNLIRREKIRVRDLFVREINMYDKILSFFEEFQMSKGVNPMTNGYKECAKCYFSMSDELSECLFLEDLKLRHFEMIKRNEPISYDHMSIVMKALGKFHAISFALKDQQPEKFNELTGFVFEQYWDLLKGDMKNHYFDMLNRLTTVLEEEKRFDLLNRFKNVVGEDYIAKIFQLVSSTAAEPYAVICHGDVTINNSMFRYNEHNKPIDFQLLDWQFSRYASPVTDLVLYLFCSTTKELRDQHYEDFLKIYHNSLVDLLIRLGSDPNKLFPYEALLDQVQQFGIYAVFVGAFLIPVLYADLESIPDLDDVAAKAGTDDSFFDDTYRIPDGSKKAYNKKVTDIFTDFARLDYI